jgi:hypothetical protein
MLPRPLVKFHLNHIEPDLVYLAFINGISGMALNGAAIFGMLAVLSGSYLLHGFQVWGYMSP